MAAWNLDCPWCEYRIVVSPRGGHGKSQGNAHEAALMMQSLMQSHVSEAHAKSWQQFLWESQ